MTEEESLRAAIEEEVALVPYDAAWPQRFDLERARLLALLPDTFVAIEHIGSTAVPGMPAKPIVDLLAGVRDLSRGAGFADILCRSGYTTSAEFNDSLVDRKWFMRWADGHRTHHLHVVVHGGPAWQERLAFRDRLRADPRAAKRYAELKARLAALHGDDREAYTDAKAEFIRDLIAGPRVT